MKAELILKELYEVRDQAALVQERTSEIIKKLERSGTLRKKQSSLAQQICSKRKAKLLNHD